MDFLIEPMKVDKLGGAGCIERVVDCFILHFIPVKLSFDKGSLEHLMYMLGDLDQIKTFFMEKETLLQTKKLLSPHLVSCSLLPIEVLRRPSSAYGNLTIILTVVGEAGHHSRCGESHVVLPSFISTFR